MERPVPIPRRRASKSSVSDQVDNVLPTPYENVDLIKPKAEPYENVKLVDDSKFVPKPAPRRKVVTTENEVKVPNADEEKEEVKTENHDNSVPKSTGAIRKAPQVPKLMNDVKVEETEKRERRNSSHSTNSGCSSENSSYKTASPKDILKSIGATSKLLSESISERISLSRKSAVHKVEKSISNSRDKMETWTLEKTKKAQKKFQKLKPSSGFLRQKKENSMSVEEIDNRHKSVPNDEVFREISFTSPIKSNVALEDLSRLSMYEVPKKMNEKLPSYDEVVNEKNFKRNNLSKSLINKSSNSYSLVRNLSETNLHDIRESSSSSASVDSLPPPKFPPPVLDESLYGKVRKLREDSDDEVTLRHQAIASNRGTFDVNEDLPSLRSSISNDKCESWSYMDQSLMLEEENSSPEPIYQNNTEASKVYEMISDMQTNLLKPVQPCMETVREVEEQVPPDICEFDPLMTDDRKDSLRIIENILNGDTYTNISLLHPIPGQLPMPPERFDSLPTPVLSPAPTPPHPKPVRAKNKNKKKDVMIIHQNLRLRSESVEALDEEAEIQRYLAKVDDGKHKNSDADLRHPKKQTTQWHVNNLLEDSSIFEKQLDIDPINTELGKAEKIKKIMIHNIPDDTEELPSYDEAVNELFPSTSSNTFKSKLSSFLKINRRPSFKKSDVKTIIELIPRPPISEKYVSHSGNLLKLPSGPFEDILRELSPRYVDLKDHKLNTYQDSQLTQVKERFPLKFVTSVQCIQNHKFNSESGVELHCFEINVAIPKQTNIQMSNPNIVLTTNNNANFKTQKYSYIYGVHRKSERNNWMQKILHCFTDVFPENYAAEFTRAGWCYVKKSVTSEWSGAWLLLCRRRLLFYTFADKVVENLDLRKARMLSLKENDETTNILHVEKGPVMLIDCPPYSLYLIMDSPRETKLWRAIVKDAALFNGPTLKQQQLTKDNVPVIIDKCINFIYAHGSMTEGIYRKVGASTNVQKLLKLFRQDAFSVQLTRSEYNEHDVSSTLKKFMRELPTPLLGTQAMQFISISDMRSEPEKVVAYKELLERIPSIEYQTLKKIIGHLHFIESQKIRNKMNIDNLSMIWGPTLIRNPQLEDVQYSQKECDVIKDLIRFYRDLYPLSAEEINKEKIMLSVLKRYHEAAENLSDAVKKSGDLRIWIAIDTDVPECEEEKSQVCVTLTPLKTVYEVCKELCTKLGLEAYKTTLFEIVFETEMERPMHYNEKVLDTVLRWTSWPDDDRKNNSLVLKPTKFLYEIERAISVSLTLTPNSELKYADRRSKNLKSYMLELTDSKITVLKKEKQGVTKIRDINLARVTTFMGCESKREQSLRWAITLIENDFKKRSKDSPFAGHIIGFDSYQDRIVWYSSIMHSMHKNDLLPSPEIIIP